MDRKAKRGKGLSLLVGIRSLPTSLNGSTLAECCHHLALASWPPDPYKPCVTRHDKAEYPFDKMCFQLCLRL